MFHSIVQAFAREENSQFCEERGLSIINQALPKDRSLRIADEAIGTKILV